MASLFGFIAVAAAAQVGLVSPDGHIELRVSSDGASYSVVRNHEQVISPSQLGLRLEGAAAYSDLRLVETRKFSRDRTIPLTASKARTARDAFNGAVLTFEEAAGTRRRLSIEARAYNDGVAFRYLAPIPGSAAITEERTTFQPAGDPTCYVSEYAGPHENSWAPVKVSALERAKLYDYPMVCASPSGQTHFALAQAELTGYAGSGLKPTENGLQVVLSRRPDNKVVAIAPGEGLTSAWRVVMMADRAGDLIESNLIGNLSAQAQGDYSWVKPGKAAWDWWSGPLTSEKPTMERYRRFIDFAAESGFPYFLIDAGWALNAGPCCAADEKTDITRSDPAIDVPALVAYARSKGVGLLLWAHWKHVEPRMTEVLDTYQRWGIKGVKVDFMERDDQEMVAFYVRLARETARRHLLLDMHGAFPPTGLARTYPNYITQEGVMGAEYNKFTWGQVTPGHNVKLAYTRMLLGPMDYTPGGFRNSTPETYVAREVSPMTRMTRGQALAQYVVYESPLQMVSDDPEAYANASGFAFLKAVPTAWDETRFVDGAPDSHVVVARRKGATWYVGAMTNEQARTVAIPLAFLGEGRFQAEIWQDGAGPNDVDRIVKTVSSRDVLEIRMSVGGGAAITLKPDR
ncbi:MAG: glycoside hydrolase family 97 protein [Caulobacter sp.]|nr:glycoside hydrolase family 97 protein [Caulobacter sp.]